MFACMDASLKNVCTASLGIKYAAYYILGRLTLRFQTCTVQIHPPFNILTLPNWLTVKFHHSLIGSTVKILNTLFLLAHLH